MTATLAVKLTENQEEVLANLEFTNIISSCPLAWCAPIDAGGTNGSHHSATLHALARRGLVQYKQRGEADPAPGTNGRSAKRRKSGSKLYRITDAGRAALAQIRAARK